MEDKKSILRKKAMKLPESPGVYIMKNQNNDVIYVGKSKTLKNRVSQYFGSSSNHNDKVKKMVSNVDNFEYILTDSEFEALVLECSLIKQYMPKYNILLKDDKGYSYIKITNEAFPRIKEVKQIEDDDSTYLGPYTSSWVVNQTIDQAVNIFKLPTCNRKFPRDIGKKRPCLNYYIKKCMAPCMGKVKQKEYNEYVKEAVAFLKGENVFSIKELTEEMNELSENLEFEKAAKIRDRIKAIKLIKDKQKVVETKEKEHDVIALAKGENIYCFEVFRFLSGRLCDREEFLVSNIIDEKNARIEFLQQYYSIRDRIPKLISIDEDIDDKELLEDWLSKKSGKSVKIINPKRGEKAALINMCKSNAFERVAQNVGRIGKETMALEELKKLLSLKKFPSYVEAYDISNTAGSENVGAMVVFKDGRPLKSSYRKFIIKTVEYQDDYSSMKEMITRRFEEYNLHKGENEGFGRLPDLILLDGGKGHVSSIKPIIDEMNYDIPVFGMVKGNKHRTRAIAAKGEEISISSNKLAFDLVTNIQDEVHRFVISFHRKKRSKALLSVTLSNIKGVGEKRSKILLKHFKSIKRISTASLEELSSVSEINQAVAKNIYSYFHDNEKD